MQKLLCVLILVTSCSQTDGDILLRRPLASDLGSLADLIGLAVADLSASPDILPCVGGTLSPGLGCQPADTLRSAALKTYVRLGGLTLQQYQPQDACGPDLFQSVQYVCCP